MDSVLYKENTFKIENKDEGIATLNKIVSEINNKKCSISSTLWNVLSTILGFCNTGIAIGLASFSMGALPTQNMFNYLDQMYTEIYLDMTHPYTGPNIKSVTITQKYRGTYQGKNKGYVYVAEKPTYKMTYK